MVMKRKVLSTPFLLDDRIRGFPTGHEPVDVRDIACYRWRPFDGQMSLPLLSLDEAAFAGNARAMLAYAARHHVALAPHAKTPMSPDLAWRLVTGGAWGATVADIRQASVLLQAGIKQLIIANEIGGRSAVTRLANLLAGYQEAEIYLFVDSHPLVESLMAVWQSRADLPRLRLLVELGAARAGIRDIMIAQDLVDRILAEDVKGIELGGVGVYEGAASVDDRDETLARIDQLLDDGGRLYHYIRAKIGATPLVMSAGGSAFFDRVVMKWTSFLAQDAYLRIILRSGAIFFHDHGIYQRQIAEFDRRNGEEPWGGDKKGRAQAVFVPALRLWAEILSRPSGGEVIAGFGMRDASYDQDLPIALNLYRDGHFLRGLDQTLHVARLNDQHAFLRCDPKEDIRIGDVIEFGISHPCTCLDRYRVIYGLDERACVTTAYPTFFG